MSTLSRFGLPLLLASLGQACSVTFPATIDSVPVRGAAVDLQDLENKERSHQCHTPCSLEMAVLDHYKLTIRRPGYHPVFMQLHGGMMVLSGSNLVVPLKRAGGAASAEP